MKQVSIEILKVIVNSLSELKKVSPEELTANSEFAKLSTAKNSDWITWNQLADWMHYMDSSSWAPIDWRQVGELGFEPQKVPLAASVLRMTLSVRNAYWLAAKWFGPSQFRVVTGKFEDIGKHKIRETLQVSEALKPCPQIFAVFAGTLSAMPKSMFGLPSSEVVFSILDGRKAIYEISFHQKNSLLKSLLYISRNILKFRIIYSELEKQQTALTEQATNIIDERNETKLILSNFPDGIMIHRQGAIVYANKLMCSFLNYSSPEEVVGLNSIDLVVPSQRDEVKKRISNLNLDPRFINAPAEISFLKHKSDEVFIGECSSMKFTFDGQPAVLVVTRDLTERKKFNSHLLTTDRLTSLGQLAAGVGHEINNPLCYVLLKMDSIKEATLNQLDAHAQKELKEVTDGLNRIQAIVKDLKALSPSHKDDKLEPVDIESSMNAAISIASNEIQHRAKLVVTYDKVSRVLANEAQLGQVFLNLLINAAHAIEPGQAIQNEIKVRIFSKSQKVLIQVSDTGSGISEEVKKNLFKPFFTTKPAGLGTGLGLSICQSIINRHHGTIELESTLGVGTSFTISFPALSENILGNKPEEGRINKSVSVDRMGHILIIDDDLILLQTLESTIKSKHKTTAVNNAADALALIRDGETFDAIVCDLMMPNLGGIDFYELLFLQSPQLCERVMFLTGGSFTEQTDKFLTRPGIRYLEKPIKKNALLAALNEVFERSIQAEQLKKNIGG